MPKYRLRYQATDLELSVGEFVIGRSSSCSLSLDDGLVSRRHAVIHTTGDRVTVEDLGSRNGVLLNGQRIKGLTQARHMDRITIGGQELVLMEVGRTGRPQRNTSVLAPCTKCGALLNQDDSFCAACGTQMAALNQTLPGATLEVKLSELDPDDETKQATGFTLLTSIADKALALSRFEEAERILGQHLKRLLEKVKAGKKPRLETVHHAATYALKLARGPKGSAWVDWVFEMYAGVGTVPPAETVDELYKVVRDIGYADARALRAYLSELDAARPELSAAGRFSLSRLQGLERVISA